jgi:putative Mn2+ efflux pump MntP
MSLWYTLGIALGLARYAFPVSVAADIQITALDYKHVARLALSFGLYHFFMTPRERDRRPPRAPRRPCTSGS